MTKKISASERCYEYESYWCNVHNRPAILCEYRGGITLPCRVVDLHNQLIIYYEDKENER